MGGYAGYVAGGWSYSDYKAKLSLIAIVIASWNWAWQLTWLYLLTFCKIVAGLILPVLSWSSWPVKKAHE